MESLSLTQQQLITLGYVLATLKGMKYDGDYDCMFADEHSIIANMEVDDFNDVCVIYDKVNKLIK